MKGGDVAVIDTKGMLYNDAWCPLTLVYMGEIVLVLGMNQLNRNYVRVMTTSGVVGMIWKDRISLL